MYDEKVILVIGEVFVDVHLDINDINGPLTRLGGVFHSARAFSALNVNYALAYCAPDYLEDDINYYSCLLNAKGCYKIGNINNAPNTMLVRESKEIAHQGYCNILKDQATYTYNDNIKKIIEMINPTDILIYPGRYNAKKIIDELAQFKGRIHIDFHYDSEEWLNEDAFNIETAMLSTSSALFRDRCSGTFEGALNYVKKINVKRFLLKENRGGASSYCFADSKMFESPSYYVPTMHSVGVGDVYNSVFIGCFFEEDINKNMRFASLCAAKYAETMSFDKFKENVAIILANVDEAVTLKGVRLSWEERQLKNIYIAAPDFPYVDTKLLDELANSLNYHNFVPRLPIRENGLVHNEMKVEEEIAIYQKDIKLIYDCDLLIAVLLFNDPGTLVELGMFKQTGKPTIIYDPYKCCKNMFVRHTPDFLCFTIAEVLDATYECLKRR